MSVKEAASESNSIDYEPHTNAEKTGIDIEGTNSSWWTSNKAPYSKKYDSDQQLERQGGLKITPDVNIKKIQYEKLPGSFVMTENKSTDIIVAG